MEVFADLYFHSRYSRAVSQEMVLAKMADWGEKKGIDLLATGDWTHPLWLKEIEANLEEDEPGIYKLKKSDSPTRFLLSCEISNIYTQGGRGRRVHTIFLAPSVEVVDKINTEIKKRGGNLISDGRPILGLTVMEMCEIVWGIDERVIVIPAHIWTPWFAMFGSKSGFDSIEECFGNYSDRIYAIETGLSSDPSMNWRIKDLAQRTIVSFSDAHSLKKLGREVTVFQTVDINSKNEKYNYNDVFGAIKERFVGNNKGKLKIKYTIEFHPEEGKYHYTGHRKCQVCQSPEETNKKGTICHVCGKPLTVGVMHRVDDLARDSGEFKPIKKSDKQGIVKYFHPVDKTRPPYVMLVPLQEILSEALGVGVASKRVQEMYQQLVNNLGSEFKILLETNLQTIEKLVGKRVADGIKKVRGGEIMIKPGYDGVFGEVRIWPPENEDKPSKNTEQQTLF